METGDGVEVEVEDEPQIIQNENPEVITGLYTEVLTFLQTYGWCLVVLVLLLLYIKSKLEPSLKKRREKAEDEKYQKKFDSSAAQSRIEAMERSRQRLQAEHDAKAAVFAEKQKIKEEEKRQQKIEEWNSLQEGKGYHSKVKPKEETDIKGDNKTKPKRTLRQTDYNPLMGGFSSGYRPSRRSGGG